MDNKQPLKAGLIGCGNIGTRAHAPAYAKLPGVNLAAACDLVRERAEAVAAGHDAEVFSDYRTLLDRHDIDLVDICVPTGQHAALIVAALEAGKHVLCEKPVARTLEQARQVQEAAAQSGKMIMIGHTRRFDHRYIEMKKVIESGELGQPVYIRRAERQRLPFPPDTWHWQADDGGGVVMDICIHIADLLRWYYAEDPLSVYAVGHRVHAAARQAESYDHALITFTFPGGKTGYAEASWAYPPDFGGGLYASLDVVGTLGKLQYTDQDSNPMLTFDAETGLEAPRFFRFMSGTEYAFEAEIDHFVRCIQEDRPPRLKLADAVAALELTLGAKRSIETGQPVTFPLQEGLR